MPQAGQQAAALVTGASRGIGAAVCEELLRAGRRVVASARDQAALRSMAERFPGRVAWVAADLAQPGEAERLARAAEEAFGPLDEAVLCAGIVRYGAVGSISETDLRAQLEVNFVAPFLLAQAVGGAMAARGRGAIVLVASTLGQRPAPLTAAYSAAKAALLSATRSFAVELAPAVRVNALAPGVVDTDMVRALREPPRPGESQQRARARQLEQLRQLHPLGRLGLPADVAAAAKYLLEAPWITGTVLTVDGGLTAS